MMLLRWAGVLFLAAFLSGCGGGGGNDDQGRFAATLTLTGFPDSGTVGGHYQMWAVIDGVPRSMGDFVVDGQGPTAQIFNGDRTLFLGSAGEVVFGPSSTRLGERFPFVEDASHYFVTFEPDGDRFFDPSCQVLVAGIRTGNESLMTNIGELVDPNFVCANPATFGPTRLGLPQLGGATGNFRLMSPTDDVANAVPNDHAGVWFVVPTGMGQFASGLNMPDAPNGWQYEGWARVDGVWRSTGKFVSPTAKDDDASFAPQRGDDAIGPLFPGQDFVRDDVPFLASDPPALRLARTEDFPDGDFNAFITIEPSPDNDVAPFGFRVLQAVIPANAVSAGGRTARDVVLANLASTLPIVTAIPQAGSVVLNQIGLPILAAGGSDRLGHYELFSVIGGVPASVCRFVVDGQNIVSLDSGAPIGTTTQTVFDDAANGALPFPAVQNATEFFVTLECQGDADGVPAASVLIDGVLNGGSALLTTAGQTATGGRGIGQFATVSGTFQLHTATDIFTNPVANDAFGILFRRLTGRDTVGASLVLPTLPAGFKYEGWVEERLTGFRYSTGKFTSVSLPDEDDMTSLSRGPDRKRGFPGEEFINAVPTSVVAAAQPGSITEVMVTLEPFPDNSRDPSFIVILSAAVPPNAVVNGVSAGTFPMTNVFNAGTAQTISLKINNE